MTKTHWRSFQNTKYLGAYAFQPGERIVATISHVQTDSVKGQNGDEEKCGVLYFKEDIKPLVLNVTNSESIERVAGSEYVEDWAGVKIELYVQEGIRAFGKVTSAVRIKSTPPRIEKPELTQQHPAWDKVVSAVADGYTRAQVEEKYTVTNDAWEAITAGEAANATA